MRKFLFITMVMLLSVVSITYANTPCCNNKMNRCTTCAKGCDKPNCLDYCSKSCKASGECTTKFSAATVLASNATTGVSDTLKTNKVKPAKVQYTCTMHPEVLSDKPGKCTKCGMELVKKEPAKSKAEKMTM